MNKDNDQLAETVVEEIKKVLEKYDAVLAGPSNVELRIRPKDTADGTWEPEVYGDIIYLPEGIEAYTEQESETIGKYRVFFENKYEKDLDTLEGDRASVVSIISHEEKNGVLNSGLISINNSQQIAFFQKVIGLQYAPNVYQYCVIDDEHKNKSIEALQTLTENNIGDGWFMLSDVVGNGLFENPEQEKAEFIDLLLDQVRAGL